MLTITTKKLLLCMVFVFTESSCMEITQLPKDVMEPIAGQLNFTSRQNLKSSCTALYYALKDEVLFLSPFDEKNYYRFIVHPQNCLYFDSIASSAMRLKLKIFAARQKDENKQMFIDVMTQFWGESCLETGCEFNLPREDIIVCKKRSYCIV